MKTFLFLLIMILAACGNPIQAVEHQFITDGAVTVKIHKQGVRVSLAPADSVTYQSATYELVVDTEGMTPVSNGTINMAGENFIPITAPGAYCLVIRIVTTDGRHGMGETCFIIAQNEVKNLLITAILPAVEQGVSVSVTTQTAPNIMFVTNAATPSGMAIPGQIEIFRFNVTEGVGYPNDTTLSELGFRIVHSETVVINGCVLQDMDTNIVMNFEGQYETDVSTSNIQVLGDVTLVSGTTRAFKLICEVWASPSDVLQAQLSLVNNSGAAFFMNDWPIGGVLQF